MPRMPADDRSQVSLGVLRVLLSFSALLLVSALPGTARADNT